MSATSVHRINTLGLATVTAASLVALPLVAPPAATAVAVPTELTGFWSDLTQPYVDLTQNTVGNLLSIAGDWIEHPFPVLGQILANLWGYTTDIFGALLRFDIPGVFTAIDESARSIVQNTLNFIHTLTSTAINVDPTSLLDGVELPDAATIAGALISAQLGNSGPILDMIHQIVGQLGDLHVNLGMVLALAVDAAGGPLGFLNAAHISDTAWEHAITNGDWGTALNLLLTWPANVTDGLLNANGLPLSDLFDTLHALGAPNLNDLINEVGPVDLGIRDIDLPGLGLATVNMGTIQLLDLHGTAPLGGALAALGHGDGAASVDWSGATVRFADICLPIIGCNPNPLNFNISGDEFNAAIGLDGTPTGGIVPALVNWAPQQLADSIAHTTPGSWDDIFNQIVGLPGYLWEQAETIISIISRIL